jgi:hypothetical protein
VSENSSRKKRVKKKSKDLPDSRHELKRRDEVKLFPPPRWSLILIIALGPL